MNLRVAFELKAIKEGRWPRFTSAGLPVPLFIENLTKSDEDKKRFRLMLQPIQEKALLRIVLFALEIENRRWSILTMEELAKRVGFISRQGYDLADAYDLEASVMAAFASLKTTKAPEGPRVSTEKVFEQELKKKNLPTGMEDNLRLIRSIVKKSS